MIVDGFDWDGGNLAKCAKHGVERSDIEALFLGTPRVTPDVIHSDREARFIAVGRDAAGRSMFVAFTLRDAAGRRLIRPVSARYMHRKEAARYADIAEADDR